MEEYRLPESTLRTRTVMSTLAQSGIYRFFSSTNVTLEQPRRLTPRARRSPAGLLGLSLLHGCLPRAALPGWRFQTLTRLLAPLLTSIRSAIPFSKATGDPNLETTTFINKGGQKRRFPTVAIRL